MKKQMALWLAVLLLLTGCKGGRSATKDTEIDLYRGRADTGVWITYSELNGMISSEKGFQAEWEQVIERCRALRLGEIYLHVRSHCDAIYPSALFPMNRSAGSLDFDLLATILESCHQAGIALHAWINPYRVKTGDSDPETLDPASPAYRWLHDGDKTNDRNVCFSGGIYLNPGEPEVQELVIGGVRELLQHYAVDGIHFDDYFYPTTDPAFDRESYEAYCAAANEPLSLAEWRRANVNALIAGCYAAIHATDRETVFSVSPAASIERNREELYADQAEWVANGTVDVLIPQLYFGFEYPDRDFQFETLLDKWKKLTAQNPAVQLKIGLACYKLGTDAEYDAPEWQTGEDIIARETEICIRDGAAAGVLFFSYSSLFADDEIHQKQRDHLQAVLRD